MYYLIVVVLLFLVELFYFRLADRFDIIDRPNERSSHKRITLRGGGIIFYFGALAYFMLSGGAYPWFMLGLTLISLISFVDDIRSTSQLMRLFLHFSAMALMFYEWGLFALPWWTFVIALVVCTGMINMYNFMDGINGITGGYSLVLLGILAYVNAEIRLFVEPEMIYTMMCAVVVFCFFNFRKRAKCFAGDVGAVSIAFVLLFLLGKLIVATGDFSWLVVVAVYGADCILTIVHRMMLHENIGLPHRKHMYQIMANELHLPHVVVSLIYMGAQLLVMIGYFCFRAYGYWYLGAMVLVLGAIYVVFMRKYYRLHEETLASKVH